MKANADDVFRKYEEELTLEAKKAIINCKTYAQSYVQSVIQMIDAPPKTKN